MPPSRDELHRINNFQESNKKSYSRFACVADVSLACPSFVSTSTDVGILCTSTMDANKSAASKLLFRMLTIFLPLLTWVCRFFYRGPDLFPKFQIDLDWNWKCWQYVEAISTRTTSLTCWMFQTSSAFSFTFTYTLRNYRRLQTPSAKKKRCRFLYERVQLANGSTGSCYSVCLF